MCLGCGVGYLMMHIASCSRPWLCLTGRLQDRPCGDTPTLWNTASSRGWPQGTATRTQERTCVSFSCSRSQPCTPWLTEWYPHLGSLKALDHLGDQHMFLSFPSSSFSRFPSRHPRCEYRCSEPSAGHLVRSLKALPHLQGVVSQKACPRRESSRLSPFYYWRSSTRGAVADIPERCDAHQDPFSRALEARNVAITFLQRVSIACHPQPSRRGQRQHCHFASLCQRSLGTSNGFTPMNDWPSCGRCRDGVLLC